MEEMMLKWTQQRGIKAFKNRKKTDQWTHTKNSCSAKHFKVFHQDNALSINTVFQEKQTYSNQQQTNNITVAESVGKVYWWSLPFIIFFADKEFKGALLCSFSGLLFVFCASTVTCLHAFLLPVLQHLFSPSVWNQSPVCSDWFAGPALLWLVNCLKMSRP